MTLEHHLPIIVFLAILWTTFFLSAFIDYLNRRLYQFGDNLTSYTFAFAFVISCFTMLAIYLPK